jgi:hypothetical protein
MSSYASSPLSSYATPPEGVASVPSFSLSMGTRTSGEEEFPPMLGVDDFAIVNPDFWDMDETRNDRSLYHGWMGFAEVSVCLLICECNFLTFICFILVGTRCFAQP